MRYNAPLMLSSGMQLLTVVAAGALGAGAGLSQTAAVYTAAQAVNGMSVYQANCSNCHIPDLSGRNEAPQLAGGNFMNVWGPRTTSDLIRYMQATMPPAN